MNINFFNGIVMQHIFSNSTPQSGRCLTYTFVIIAAIWLSIANYYYFTENSNNSYGALLSGVGCLALALVSLAWEYYLKQKAFKESVTAQLIAEYYPMIESVYSKLQVLKQNKELVGAASTGLSVIAGLYLLSSLKSIRK